MRYLRLPIIVLLIFSSALLSAQELIVTVGNRSYLVGNSSDLITFKSHDVDLSINRKKCNAHIMDRFSRDFKKLTLKPFLSSSRPGFIEVKINGIKSFEPKQSERGIALANMYEDFKKMKIEDQLSCPK